MGQGCPLSCAEDKGPKAARSSRNLSGSNNGDETHFSRIGARRPTKKDRDLVSCGAFLIALWFTATSSIIWRTDLLVWPTWSAVDRQSLVFLKEKSKSAAKHFAVVTQVKGGQIYWRRPTNLFAIWWVLDRAPEPQ